MEYGREITRLYVVSAGDIAEECSEEAFLMLKYTVACSNKYFRLLHVEGLWMDPEVTLLVVKAGDEMCASRL